MNKKLIVGVSALLIILGGGAWLYGQSVQRSVIQSAAELITTQATTTPTPPCPVPTLSFNPRSIVINQATTTTISTDVLSAPHVLRNDVQLIRYDESDKFVANLGKMYDDGSHGDRQASDNIFTTNIVFNELTPGSIFLQASVACRGTLTRSQSNLTQFIVWTADTPEGMIQQLASDLENGNVEAVVQHFKDKRDNHLRVRSMDAESRTIFARLLRNGVFTKKTLSESTYLLTNSLPGGTTEYTLILNRSSSGAWIVDFW